MATELHTPLARVRGCARGCASKYVRNVSKRGSPVAIGVSALIATYSLHTLRTGGLSCGGLSRSVRVVHTRTYVRAVGVDPAVDRGSGVLLTAGYARRRVSSPGPLCVPARPEGSGSGGGGWRGGESGRYAAHSGPALTEVAISYKEVQR